VLEWSSEYGDLVPPLCVVKAHDEAAAVDRAIELAGDHFTGAAQGRCSSRDVAEWLFHVVTFRGDLSSLVASEGHAVLRESVVVDER
jgi:hypothetical protein